MTGYTTTQSASPSALRRQQERDFRFIYGVSFLLFLAAATVLRLLPWRWSVFHRGSEPARSVLDEARATTNRVVPFVFMN